MYPNEPTRPRVVTDRYIVELQSWGNSVIGIATSDRLAWRGERRCIRRKQAEGLVR